MQKLNITAFGLASGCLFALTLIIYSIIAEFTGVGIEIELAFESLLPGYTLTLAGVMVGAIWQFSIGYLGAALFACIYNTLLNKK